MITSENFELFLSSLNFTLQGKNYSKVFTNGASLTVDFENKKLIYPDGLKINEQQTCNFSAAENFVVFECVHRLLEKGYAPESIELEPKWKLGHGASGGRADILVKDLQNNPLLIIECKTAGKELNRAWDKTRLDGGQLFSYVQQEKSVKFICLYASDFNGEKLSFNHYIITVADIQNEIEKDANKELKRLFYKDAQTVKQLYQVWKETYLLDYQQSGIFENDVQAYNIGKQKLTLNDLKQISDDEMKGKYNQFAEILRTQNVSSKESAFDKLINLFLCKIADEKQSRATGKELEFYWKGEYFDDYFSLLDRLQKLYKDGMGEFLGEKITYIDNKKITDGFVYFKQDKNATQDYILKLFKEQKYFTNSDFGFIDVHNDKLFYQNAVILLEVIRMWQNYQLTSEQQHQFLGNMFELFLDKGFKQSEGQFFTPIPICKFILQSLPLEKIVKTNPKPPKVMDYACGSGHFLTEYASQIKAFIDSTNSTELKKYYAAIYGVEKEYRLSKVAKISAFMYGQDEINVIYCDALNTIQQEISGKVVLVEDETIDILVANPPFAVDGFLTTLPADKRYDYTLFNDSMDAKSQNNIQCFFIERAMQLLKPNGIAAIIVPSSVLSNSDKTHVGSREILLKFFDIVALVELGSGTFGKTPTNTVVLFLRRKHKQPPESEQYFNRVNDWFSPIKDGDEVYNDRHFIERYCQHIGIPLEQYETLLNGKPSTELLTHEMFVDYQKQFDGSSDITKLKTQKFFKGFTPEQKQIELEKRFLIYLQTIEKDKLFYFVLAHENPQKVLVIKSPSDNKEQKAFLGYEWSGRKGDEGIKLTADSNGKHLTPLYDETNRDNPEKINALITQNFLGELTEIPDVLQPFASLVNLIDMLDFSRKDFDKTISLMEKKSSVEIESRWDLMKLENLMTIVRGASPRPIDKFLTNESNGINWIKIGDVKEGDKYITQTAEKITPEGAEKSRFVKEGDFILSNSMSSGRPYILKISGCIHDGWLLLSQFDNRLTPDYFYYLLSHYDGAKQQLSDNALGGIVKNLNIDRVKNIKIPLPPLDIQQQIVSECEVIDLEVEKAELTLKNSKTKINDLFTSESFTTKRLAEIALKVSDNVNPQEQEGDVDYIGLENIESETGRLVGDIKTAYSTIKSTKSCFKKYDVLYGKLRPNLNKVYLAERDGICSTDILVFRFESQEMAKFYAYYFLSKQFNNEVLKGVSGQQLPRTSWNYMQMIKIPVPDLATQQKLVSEIEVVEKQIDDAQKVIDGAANRKAAVLRKYLLDGCEKKA